MQNYVQLNSILYFAFSVVKCHILTTVQSCHDIDKSATLQVYTRLQVSSCYIDCNADNNNIMFDEIADLPRCNLTTHLGSNLIQVQEVICYLII